MKLKRSLLQLSLLAVLLNPLAYVIADNQTQNQLQTGHELQFDSPEHFDLGAYALLSVPSDQGGVDKIYGNKLTVKSLQTSYGQMNLSFADIFWLGGDLIGEPKQIIGLSANPASTFESNLAAFDKYKDYIPAVLTVYSNVSTDVKKFIDTGSTLVVPDKYNYEYNQATGGWGGSIGALLKSGLYLKLAQYNYDHFGNNAVKSYITGHTLALEYASKATNVEGLKYAYFIEGYADHFLTDLFATGHSRTPRVEIVNYCANLGQGPASFLTKLMHDQDGTTGLTLVNGKGETWFGTGDENFYTPANKDNKIRALSVVQQSVDQIYNAYVSKNANTTINNAEMKKVMPDVDATANLVQNTVSYPQMYKVVKGTDGSIIINEYDAKTKSYHQLKCLSSAAAAAWNYVFN
ncbi:MAG: hypothetical protein EKK54_05100 [Neisseriaceae bacterium]|nr:MAG: hypothetical protein EKK54_05100 [Neisseriaceae bacterium]